MSDIDIFAKTTSCVDIKNDVVSNIDFEIMKAMKKANDSLAEELAKYKRAFEILKKYDFFTLVGRDKDNEDCLVSTVRSLKFLELEEYELLEELMRDGKI